jgi:hypothetical protein
MDLEKRIEKLEIIINKLNTRISVLEDNSKCNLCNNIELLYNCFNCDQRICHICCISKYKKIFNDNEQCLRYCIDCKYF